MLPILILEVFGITNKPASWEQKGSRGVIGYSELIKIRWCQIMNGFVGEENEFDLYSGFNREPVQRSQ